MKKLLLILLLFPLVSFGQNEGYDSFLEKKSEKLVPDDANAYNDSGNEKYDLKDYYGAIADYTKAIELDPDFDAAYFRRGLSKHYLKDYYGAIADYTKSIGFDPDYASTYSNRGWSKAGLEDYYGAIADYTKAIELNPNYANAYSNRGLAKYDLKDHEGAIADYTKAIELDPDFDAAYYNRGSAKNFLKDYYGAIADYTKSIGFDPDYAGAYSNRGISKENIGDLNGACVDWRKAAGLGDADSEKWVRDQCGDINNSSTSEISIIGSILTQKKQKGISGILIYVNGTYITNSNYKGYYNLKANIGDVILFEGKRIGSLRVIVPKEFTSNKDNVIGIISYSSIIEKLSWPVDVNDEQRLDWMN